MSRRLRPVGETFERPALRRAVVAVVAVASLGVVPSGPAVAQEAGASGASGAARFKEVGRLEFTEAGSTPSDTFADSDARSSGWLILNPKTRRGYQVFETSQSTIVQSFDLDSLRPLRRFTLAGFPITSGPQDVGGPTGTAASGEVVHAVDEEAGRVYLALGLPLATPVGAFSLSPDSQRQFVRFVAIDEAALDGGQPFLASFGLPPSQARLSAHFLLGMKATRYGEPAGSPAEPAKLLAVWASPTTSAFVPFVPGAVLPTPFDHELVQLDPAQDLALQWQSQDASTAAFVPPQPLTELGTWAHHLTGCGTAPMGSGAAGDGNYQWGLLATSEAVHVGCHSSPGAGAVVRVALTADEAIGRVAPPAGGETVYPLSTVVSDVLVDDVGQRLLLRSWVASGTLMGHTWWVFDADRSRYAGSIAALQNMGVPMAAGIDPTTGRLYSLTPDHAGVDSQSRQVPVRGGLQLVDTRLDPVPPFDNVRPDLAYNGAYAIRVDPATRRVFVRRGRGSASVMATYPSVQPLTPSPIEPFYRVFEDRVPPPEQPGDIDDSGFTSDVAEAEGLTTASYLASGAGYGARVVLTGGTRALAGGVDLQPTTCSGKEDRELLAGSVGSVSVSDLSITAEAAALDGDGRTRATFGDPVNRCKHAQTGETCTSPVDTDELAFDDAQDPRVDDNDDGCDDRTGANLYAAGCIGGVGDGTTDSKEVDRKVPRDGFKATATCDSPDQRASGTSTTTFSSSPLLADMVGEEAAGRAKDQWVRVGFAQSKVEVDRNRGEGVTVRVDSVARGIEIAGVGSIAVVRTEATSRATGRGNGAKGDFTRVICGVSVGNLREDDCIRDPSHQQRVVDALNLALGSRGRARLRQPDDVLKAGSRSGYRAAVQREHDDLFADRVIDRDASLAVPGLQITFFMGDGGSIGAARQIVQLAGVQAATSYGVACLYGNLGGRCAREGEGVETTFGGGGEDASGDPLVTTIIQREGTDGAAAARPAKESRIVRLLKAPFRAAAEALRLLFNNPRELGLMAAVWALLYAPCYLGERRRSIDGLRARRAALGGST